MWSRTRPVVAALDHHVRSNAFQLIRSISCTTKRAADFTHAVVGGGVVGLAIARRLQAIDGAQVVLIEKHGVVGSETSSRNSEVIHAGIYYGHATLKTRLCLRGKQMMYDLAEKQRIPYMNCGKWVVAQTDDQMAALQSVHDFAKSIDVPIGFISPDEARRREPDVRAEAGALESPTTGIIDSHGFMQFLQADFEQLGGTTALASEVTQIQTPSAGEREWKVWTASSTKDGERDDEQDFITAETLINSAGLYACAINNMVLPSDRHRKPFYAKGSYFSYAKSWPKPSKLIYPAPVPGHGGLGTHLTLDMGGRVRFGPDLEWVESPTDLAPSADPERFAAAVQDIKSYLPGVDEDAIALDYAGIRPKLGKLGAVHTKGKEFQDFYIANEAGLNGTFINLLGIESPGLTSSLAIAEEVHRLLYS